MKVLCLLSLLSFVTSFRPFFVNRFLGKNTQLNTIPIREPFSNSDSLRRYPLSRQHYQRYLKKMSDQNSTNTLDNDEGHDMIQKVLQKNETSTPVYPNYPQTGLRIIINKDMIGAFENNETRKFLLKNSTIVWLYANIETLISRVGDANNRPMLKGDVKSTFETLVNKRNKNYQKSHLKIMTDNRSFQEICDIITESFQ